VPARAVAAANAAGTVEPADATFIAASAVLPFVDGQIYHVLTAPEAVTDIVLQPGEMLGSVAAGDTARWVIGDTTSGAVPINALTFWSNRSVPGSRPISSSPRIGAPIT